MRYPKRIREAAKATADYIRKHGWRQHKDGDEGGPCCAYKAMEIASPDDITLAELKEAVLRITKTVYVLNWNDKPARTKEEVIDLFEKIGA